MKILMISPGYNYGMGHHVNMLTKYLLNYGYDVSKMIIPYIPIKNYKNPSFTLFSTMRSMVDWRKYDIVHAFNVPSAFAMKYTNAKKKVLSIQCVFSDQTAALHSKTLSNIAAKTERRVIPWADVITTDSLASKRRYQELGFEFEIMPSGIDLEACRKIPKVAKKKRQVVYVGRDSYEKGIDLLRSIESEINGDVVYCTNLPWEDAMKVLQSSAVMVLPSRYESHSIVIKEAFFFKVPVVGTNTGGIPELITHNETGYLVESENKKQLLNSINKVLENPESSEIITDNAYKTLLEKMTWDAILPKYVNFYENLLK